MVSERYNRKSLPTDMVLNGLCILHHSVHPQIISNFHVVVNQEYIVGYLHMEIGLPALFGSENMTFLFLGILC